MANGFIDTAMALRILYLLVIDVKTLPAFKLGLIGEKGEILRKPITPEEKKSTSMLLRLIMRIRSFLSIIPLAQSKLGSYVSAYALVRECVALDLYLPTQEQLTEHYDNMGDQSLLESELNSIYDELYEDAPANSTGAAVSTDVPAIKKRKKATFIVKRETLNNFKNGKTKFRRWANYLNIEDSVEREVYNYAKKNPRGILVLQDEDGRTKGVRYSKHGGGNWHGIKRKPKQVVESYINNLDYEVEIIEIC